MDEYLVDLNGTQAAIRAKYSEHTACEIAAENLRKPHIQTALASRWADIQDSNTLKPEMVVAELAKLAFSNMQDYMSWGPNGVTWKDSTELTREQAAAIVEVITTETKEGTRTRFKLADKVGALNSLGKYFGMFIEKHEINGTITHRDERLTGYSDEDLRLIVHAERQKQALQEPALEAEYREVEGDQC